MICVGGTGPGCEDRVLDGPASEDKDPALIQARRRPSLLFAERVLNRPYCDLVTKLDQCRRAPRSEAVPHVGVRAYGPLSSGRNPASNPSQIGTTCGTASDAPGTAPDVRSAVWRLQPCECLRADGLRKSHWSVVEKPAAFIRFCVTWSQPPGGGGVFCWPRSQLHNSRLGENQCETANTGSTRKWISVNSSRIAQP